MFVVSCCVNWFMWNAKGKLRYIKASLAQSVERETLNLKVAGSTPAWGFFFGFEGLFVIIDIVFGHLRQ